MVRTEVLAAVWEILDRFNKNDIRGVSQPSLESQDGISALQLSVLVAARSALKSEGSPPLLGVCANDATSGIASLREWTHALECPMSEPKVMEGSEKPEALDVGAPVYIKYNARTTESYVTPYQGSYRGVIIQLGQRQVGHLPLDLFHSRS
eukprot:jgi/Mesen1/2817/ME000172S01967